MKDRFVSGDVLRRARMRGVGVVGLALVSILVVAVISRATGRPYLAYLQTIILSFLVLLLLRKFVWWMRYVRGRVLMDLGPNPMRGKFRLVSVLMVLGLFFFYMDAVTSSDTTGVSVLGVAGMLILGIFAFGTALERFQLVEAGFWAFGVLTPWEKIAEYSWIPESKVVLRVRGRYARFRGHAVPIADRDRDAVEALLRSHGVPARTD